MPRVCTVCTHPEREAIDLALAGKDASKRRIAAQYGVSETAIRRHRGDHLPGAVTKSQEAREDLHAINVVAELRCCAARLNLLFNACDEWLRDASDPTKYDLGPRAEEVWVTYLEDVSDGEKVRKVKKKAKLSQLLARVEGADEVVWTETKYADPRDLILKTYDRLQNQLELIAKLIGQLDERPQVNVLVSPEWLKVRSALFEALEPHPAARAAIADRLLMMEANEYRH